MDLEVYTILGSEHLRTWNCRLCSDVKTHGLGSVYYFRTRNLRTWKCILCSDLKTRGLGRVYASTVWSLCDLCMHAQMLVHTCTMTCTLRLPAPRVSGRAGGWEGGRVCGWGAGVPWTQSGPNMRSKKSSFKALPSSASSHIALITNHTLKTESMIHQKRLWDAARHGSGATYHWPLDIHIYICMYV